MQRPVRKPEWKQPNGCATTSCSSACCRNDRASVLPTDCSFHRYIAGGIAHALLPSAPAAIRAVGHAHQECLDFVNVVVMHLEYFRYVPGPGLHRAGADGASVRCLEGACLATGMIEKAEGEGEAAFFIHGDE